jgi:hypothetical protein
MRDLTPQKTIEQFGLIDVKNHPDGDWIIGKYRFLADVSWFTDTLTPIMVCYKNFVGCNSFVEMRAHVPDNEVELFINGVKMTLSDREKDEIIWEWTHE